LVKNYLLLGDILCSDSSRSVGTGICFAFWDSLSYLLYFKTTYTHVTSWFVVLHLSYYAPMCLMVTWCTNISSGLPGPFFNFVNCRLVSKSPYPTSPEGKEADTTKPGISAAPSPDAGCFGKSLASDELQPKVASNLAWPMLKASHVSWKTVVILGS